MGSFITAFVKTKNRQKKWRDYAHTEFLEPMLRVYGDNWDGSIHEIFDANPVYEPRGCISQAWSVAETLRCLIEDIENKRPKFENEIIDYLK